MTHAPDPPALAGLRVLDLSRVLAGPLCTAILGDLGAEVIKVERPEWGDDTRQWGPPWAEGSAGREAAYFLAVNRNKRSIAVDMKTEAGRAAPTCWWRTSRRARWTDGGWATKG